MDLVTLIASVIGAFLAGCVICWLAWRWRKTTLSTEEWDHLTRRKGLVESENLRLQDRVNLLTEQSNEFPGLRTAISERDEKLLRMEHDLGIAQAREIGAVTRRDQFFDELEDARSRERQLQSEVLELREFRDEAHERLARADNVIAKARAKDAGLTKAKGQASLNGTDSASDTVAVAQLRAELAEAHERMKELASRPASGRSQDQIIDLTGEGDDHLVTPARRSRHLQNIPSFVPITDGLSAPGVAVTTDSAEAEQLRAQVARLRRRAEASSVLAADLRSRLDNQTHKARQLRTQLESRHDATIGADR